MVNRILDEAFKSLRPPDFALLDVQGDKLVVTGGSFYDVDQLRRVTLFLKGLDWDQYAIHPEDDGSQLNYFYRLVRIYDDRYSPTDRKLEMQMLKLNLKRSNLEVSDQELEMIVLLDCNLDKVTQLVTLFRRANLACQFPIMKALDFIQINRADLLEVAYPWIQGIDQWSEILLILSTVQSLLHNNRGAGAIRLMPWAQGLDSSQRLNLLLILKEIDPMRLPNVLDRLPPLQGSDTYVQKISALMYAYETAQVQPQRSPRVVAPLSEDTPFEFFVDLSEDRDAFLNL